MPVPQRQTFQRQPSSPLLSSGSRSVGSSSTRPSKRTSMGQTAKKASEIDMLDGVVNMDALSQILALDEDDPTKEFSKALVWAWCDQAEHAVEEMEHFLSDSNILDMAMKAHYLKGSSSSLGLIRVSETCEALYRIHAPPSLAHFRNYSYTQSSSSSSSGSDYFSGVNSSGSGHVMPTLRRQPTQSNYMGNSAYNNSGQSSGNNSIYGSPPQPASAEYSPDPNRRPSLTDFPGDQTSRAQSLLAKLKDEIREASEWLYMYYREHDKYAGVH